MGRVMKKITKFFDVICFVGGPVIAIVSLLSFSPSESSGAGSGLGGFSSVGIRYDEDALAGIAIGFILLFLGFVRAYWRKKEGK